MNHSHTVTAAPATVHQSRGSPGKQGMAHLSGQSTPRRMTACATSSSAPHAPEPEAKESLKYLYFKKCNCNSGTSSLVVNTVINSRQLGVSRLGLTLFSQRRGRSHIVTPNRPFYCVAKIPTHIQRDRGAAAVRDGTNCVQYCTDYVLRLRFSR